MFQTGAVVVGLVSLQLLLLLLVHAVGIIVCRRGELAW
jgi:hypothetical protein